jgi:hypothetical protein
VRSIFIDVTAILIVRHSAQAVLRGERTDSRWASSGHFFDLSVRALLSQLT